MKALIIKIVSLVLVISIAFGLYFINIYRIKNWGTELKPSKDYPIKTINYFLQNNPRWASEKIGVSNSTLGSKGCLVSCVATAITELGISVTPSEVNDKLTRVNGYAGANLIWFKINEAFPKIDYSYKRSFNSWTIEKDLQKGLLPIVNVKYLRNGATHWVIVAGAKKGEFYVLDPLNKNMKAIPLSVHGKVYSYRVLHNVLIK